MTIFAKKLRANQDASPLGKLVSGLRDQVVHGSFVTQGVAQAALSMESISEQQSIALSDATQTLSQALESIAADMNMSADMTGAQRDAAVVAGAVSGDIRAFLRQPTKMDMVSTESMHVVGSNVGDAVDQRVSVEAYDEKDNRNAVVYSIAYNLQAARQDEFGEAFFPTITVSPDNVGLFQIQNQLGDTLDPTVAPALAVATVLAGATIIGYDLRAYRTNLNRRTRGQLIDTSFYNQFYPIPLRSPITALRPVTTDGQTDTSDLAALITATHIRTSNAAVTTLLETSGMLAEYVDSRDTAGDGPDVLGISRMLVRPTYFRDTIDAATDINSLTSSDRIDDLQALIVNKIRDLAYAMYRDSNYKSASDAIYGGISKTPTVIIGTDPVIARYLMVNGDLRTLGPDFEVKVVHTVDARVSGKIFVTFGQFEGESNSKVNPLHFGNMGWKPELTLVLPISRDGQTSKELTVQPSFLHVVNLPLLAELDVQNISSVVASSVTINTHPIP